MTTPMGFTLKTRRSSATRVRPKPADLGVRVPRTLVYLLINTALKSANLSDGTRASKPRI